jgi:Family of unknown function (DUF5683)
MQTRLICTVLILICSFCSYKVTFAQNPILKSDSIRKSRNVKMDSLDKLIQKPKKDTSLANKTKILVKNTKDILPKVFGTKPYLEKEKPKVVFIRSLFLPGWGQISNKQYYKLPIVYGAAGAGGYFIAQNNQKCKVYVSYLKKLQLEKKTEILLNFNGTKLVGPDFVNGATRGPFSKELITNAAKQYRRWKQGTIIGFSAGWLLFAIDANVAAHLKSFDVTDDISATIKPSILNIQGSTAAGLTLKLNLN